MSTNIHLGPWIDWSQGPIAGATLTLSSRSGGLLTSFIATFVTIVAAQLWKILCYSLHQARSRDTPQDGLHHQQQVILRNTVTPGGAAINFLEQMWYWRGKARLSLLRTLPWILFSVVYLVIFAVLAVFSSEISKASGAQRLLKKSDQCGFWAIDNSTDQFTRAAAANQKLTNDSYTAQGYGRACYGGPVNNPRCDHYAVPSIPWTEKINVSCPFDDAICRYPGYEVTSDLINSRQHLGINSPFHQTVDYQRKTTCAPLRLTDHYRAHNITADETFLGPVGDEILEIYLGSLFDANRTMYQNMTYYYNLRQAYANIGYTLNSLIAYSDNNSETGVGLQLIPELFRRDADVSLLFLSQNMLDFAQPCQDPMFLANYEQTTSLGNTFWTYDSPIYGMACTDQHRFCNPVNNVCSPFLGGYQSLQYLIQNSSIGLDPNQMAAVVRVSQSLNYINIFSAIDNLGAAALRAQETVAGMTQLPLPNNQWQIEVNSWFSNGLARLQAAMVEYAAGPSNVVTGAYTWSPDDIFLRRMCHTQIVHDTSNTMSFSLLGMAVLFIIGGFILITSFFLERLVAWAQKRWQFALHARASWYLDDKVQLHRIAMDSSHLGSWTRNFEDGMPTTVNKEKFLGLGGSAYRDAPPQPRGNYGPVASEKEAWAGSPTSYSNGYGKPAMHEQVQYIGD